MTTADFIKLAIIGPLFFVIAPLAGLALKGRTAWQRACFAAMCFMTINGLLGPGNWGLTLGSIETYRGHTKGYHFYFNHALAIALLMATWAEARAGRQSAKAVRSLLRPDEPAADFRLMAPGLISYVAYCGISVLSIVNAPEPNLVLMTAHKMLFATLIFLAAFNWLRNDERLQFFVRVMAVTMTWQLLVVLKLKYVDGMYQVRGTFEHQNPLAMYAVLIGMVFLATGLGPRFRGANLALWGFLACALIVQCALSRAALAMFGAGTLGILMLSLGEKPTARRIGSAAALGLIGAVGLVLTLDTIVSRFRDQGNTASSELREVMNQACRQMAHDHLLGVGWNNYALMVNPPYPYAEVYFEWIRGRGMVVDESKPNAVVESHYYLLLGETGWPALIAYLLMIALGLWRNLRGFFSYGHSFRRCLALGIGIGCALNYAQSTLERVLVQPRNLMLWLILFAITARLEIGRRALRRQGRPAAPHLP